ncbi:MAG: ABC transporter permease [Rhodospirillales bacterium]|nr:ABC transporter permease [Rhodospirillales bacterium]
MPERASPSIGLAAALGLAGLAVFFAVWAGAGVLGLVSATFLPGPLTVLGELLHLLTHPYAGATLPQHLAASLQRYGGGVVLAVIVGLPLGLAMGWFRPLDAVVSPIFDGLRFVPPIAWVPFAALWFGTGAGGPVLIIFTGAFPPVLIGTYRGARMIEPALIEAARMLGTSNRRMLTEILLPGAVPSIVAGLRVAAGLGWQSLIGAELIVVSSGIGYMMVQGEAAVATSTVMAGIIAVGLVGTAIDLLLRAAERAVRRRYGLVGGGR